jgi:hypothetical protein
MAAVTVFAIAHGLIEYAHALGGGIRTTRAPRASALEGGGHGDTLRALTLQGTRYCMLLVLPIAATFGLRGSSFIGLWMGSQYAGPSGEVLAILAMRLVSLTATGAAVSVLLGASRERVVARICVAEAVVSVATVVLLVRPFGLLGVAWGTTVPTVVAALGVWPWLLRESLGVGIRRYIAASWALPIASYLPFIAATWVVERLWPAPSLLVFIAQVAALMPVALAGLWYVGLSAAARRGFLDMIRFRWIAGRSVVGACEVGSSASSIRTLPVDDGSRNAMRAPPWPMRGVSSRSLMPFLLELGQRPVDVLDLEADVKEAGAVIADPSRHARLGAFALQQLDVGLADRQHGQAGLADLLLVFERQAESVLQQIKGLRQRLHREGDVLDALDLHRGSLARAGLSSCGGPIASRWSLTFMTEEPEMTGMFDRIFPKCRRRRRRASSVRGGRLRMM